MTTDEVKCSCVLQMHTVTFLCVYFRDQVLRVNVESEQHIELLQELERDQEWEVCEP